MTSARGHCWGLVGAVTLPEAPRVGGHSLVIRDHVRKYHSLSMACKDMKGLQSINHAQQPSSLLLLLGTAAVFPRCLSMPEALLWNSFPISFILIYTYLFGCTASLLRHVKSSSLTKDQTWAPYVGIMES